MTRDALLTSNPQLQAWRTWATDHRFPAAVLAGLVGTHVASVLGFWFGGFGLTRLDWNTANGLVYLPKADPLAQFLFGGLMHYTDGILFGVLFALTFHPRMPWANSEMGNILKGVAFGTVLAVIALLVLTPLIYAPARGAEAGFFSLNFGWKYVVGTVLFHWAYGAHLGLIYSPLDSSARAIGLKKAPVLAA
ncbi:hypothetical protein [Arthrobacter woluwensis]|uniref:hypothetical protein n=1 Tax=Arthrobacter woluwensis TaxID=156980 RepID=UPI001AAE524B|nr:hypothetical protein [Arthrobacter woluwensis]QTF72592.1 hypothetical protein G8758_11700 [Arthrobacter woluwensis]